MRSYKGETGVAHQKGDVGSMYPSLVSGGHRPVIMHRDMHQTRGSVATSTPVAGSNTPRPWDWGTPWWKALYHLRCINKPSCPCHHILAVEGSVLVFVVNAQRLHIYTRSDHKPRAVTAQLEVLVGGITEGGGGCQEKIYQSVSKRPRWSRRSFWCSYLCNVADRSWCRFNFVDAWMLC